MTHPTPFSGSVAPVSAPMPHGTMRALAALADGGTEETILEALLDEVRLGIATSRPMVFGRGSDGKLVALAGRAAADYGPLGFFSNQTIILIHRIVAARFMKRAFGRTVGGTR